jgi:hypothetical protein
LSAAAPHPKPADHLIEHQQGPRSVGALAQQIQESRSRGHQPHVRGNRLGEDRRKLVAFGGVDDRFGVVPGDDHRCPGGSLGHAGTRGNALRRHPRTSLSQKPVDVTVVGTGELQDPLPAGHRTCESNRTHRGLGSG